MGNELQTYAPFPFTPQRIILCNQSLINPIQQSFDYIYKARCNKEIIERSSLGNGKNGRKRKNNQKCISVSTGKIPKRELKADEIEFHLGKYGLLVSKQKIPKKGIATKI
ncbi:hypothetical protein J7L00_03660 [Candidatus Bathyarchaeota archaeon]|nr:hypothetical protein [Candidatus Bathyarchaeota archaeon]